MARTLPSQQVKRELHESLNVKSLNATEGMVEVPITAAQKKLWEDTVTAMMWACPGFTRIMYSMCNPDGTGGVAFWTKDVPIAATDGVYLIFNPDTYFAYPLHERVFILVHEIMHMVLNHINMIHRYRTTKTVVYPSGKKLPFNAMLFNCAREA